MKIKSSVRKDDIVKAAKATDFVSPASVSGETNDNRADPHKDAREVILQGLRLSFIIYDPLDHLESELAQSGFSHIKKLNKILTGTQGLCAVRDNTAFIVFRGSASAVDWLLDFLFVPFYWPLCHFGFGSAWRSVRKPVRQWLEALPAAVDNIMICGHSLGGGVSHLAAMELAPDFPVGAVVTFGAPKACFLGTARKYDQTAIKGRPEDERLKTVTYAVVNQRDIVAKVPFEMLGFRDVGQLVYIDHGGGVNFGDDAWKARFDDSMVDMDFLFNFTEEEKTGVYGVSPRPVEGFYANMRRTMVWLGQAVPFLKTIILPSVMYILFCLYFMRSGIAHLGDKYMSVFMDPLPTWHYTAYEKTGIQKAFTLASGIVFGSVLLGAFLWGLFIIASWSVSGLGERL